MGSRITDELTGINQEYQVFSPAIPKDS